MSIFNEVNSYDLVSIKNIREIATGSIGNSSDYIKYKL